MRGAVITVLKEMGVDLAFVDERTMSQLVAVHAAVEEEAERIAEARRIASRGLPLVRLAELSGISRQTLYNKPLLRRYSERAIRDAGIEEAESERLRRTVAEQRDMIALLVKRDGELVEALARLEGSKQEIGRLNASLAEERARVVELQRMLADAKRGATKETRMVDLEKVRDRSDV